MPYPDSYSTERFDSFWSPTYRTSPRLLTQTEIRDIGTLERAKAIIEAATSALKELPLLGTAVEHSPTEALLELNWNRDLLLQSIREIHAIPAREAAAADNERGIF